MKRKLWGASDWEQRSSLRSRHKYVYVVLHYPDYRMRYAESLKDDEEVIVRLVGQVVAVSVDTMKIIRELPALPLP